MNLNSLKDALSQVERIEEAKKISDKYREKFLEILAPFEFDQWRIGIAYDSDDHEVKYIRPSKLEGSFAVKGIMMWATSAACTGHPILKEFHGVERHFGDIAPGFLVAEKDDKLIIVSTFKTRSELIQAI